MSKKQKEDNRDVFEKALDYAAPVAGAYVGGKIGAKIGRSLIGAKSSARYEKAAKAADKNNEFVLAGSIREMNNTARMVAAPFAMAGAGAGALGPAIMRNERENRTKKRRK